MTTDTLNKVQDAERINDTRKAELLSSPVEHIDITKFDARPIVEAMGKMSFTSRDLAARHRHLQPDARGPGLLDHPGRSPARPRPAAAWTSMPSW